MVKEAAKATATKHGGKSEDEAKEQALQRRRDKGYKQQHNKEKLADSVQSAVDLMGNSPALGPLSGPVIGSGSFPPLGPDGKVLSTGDEDVDYLLRQLHQDALKAAADGKSELAPAPAPAAAPASTSEAGESKDTGDGKIDETADEKKKKLWDVRVAVVGNVDSGKSTLVGVLTGGQLDNGRGLARERVFVHRHELGTGRTSSISQHIMGFDEHSRAVHQTAPASANAAAKNKSWKEVVSQSRSVVTFIDLAGHEKYLKTTIAGLTGSYPDYALVIINSLAGVTKMTKEHLGVCLALEIPLLCVVSKVDMCPTNVLTRTKQQLFKILKSPAAKHKMPISVRESKDVMTAATDYSHRVVPVFFISSVLGTNINLLLEYLSLLQPRREVFKQRLAQRAAGEDDEDAESRGAPGSVQGEKASDVPAEFSIDETFNVTGVGIVISGTVQRGVLRANTPQLLGPFPDGTFKEVMVRTIHCKRAPVEECEAGESCAVSLRATKRKETITRANIRRGMVLVDPSCSPRASKCFEAEVHVLHHPTTVKLHYQAVVHCGIIRQTAAIEAMNRDCLRTGDSALVRFRFMMRPEYIHPGATFIFREGNTKGIGRITRVLEEKDVPLTPAQLHHVPSSASGGVQSSESEHTSKSGTAHKSARDSRPPASSSNPSGQAQGQESKRPGPKRSA